MNEKLLELSNSKDLMKAKLEWEPVFYKENMAFQHAEYGYFYQNKCHYKQGDECLHCDVVREISIVTERPKLKEHCRWVNWRNLNLFTKKDTPYKCLCGEPIIYVYQIENKLNGNRIPETRDEPGIGSQCIRDYLPKCHQLLGEHFKSIIHELIPNKFCYTCKARHRRHNILPEEIVNCRKCPPLCCIIDCPNLQHSKKLCKKHLGLKI